MGCKTKSFHAIRYFKIPDEIKHNGEYVDWGYTDGERPGFNIESVLGISIHFRSL